MREKVKKVVKKAVGFTLLVVGLLFLITPFTPGSALLIFGGLELLGLRLVFEEKIIVGWNKLKTKFRKGRT